MGRESAADLVSAAIIAATERTITMWMFCPPGFLRQQVFRRVLVNEGGLSTSQYQPDEEFRMKKTLSAVAVAVVVLAGTARMASAEITIGVAGPMSGPYASFGQQMKAGAEQAVADINEAGGVNGEMLDLAIGDDACDPEQAVAVANQMADDGVVFMAGHFCSGSSIPASSVYAEEGVIMISPASTNPKFTDERPGEGIFRVCGRDDQQGNAAGKFLLERFPQASIAFVHDGSVYGSGLADATLSVYEASGGIPAFHEAYSAGKKDYTALVEKLDSENIDVLYVGGYHVEAGLMARQMRDQEMDTLVVSGDMLATEEYWSIAGDAGEGTLFTFLPDPRKNERAHAVVEELRDQGVEPEGFTLFTYAAIQVWAQAAGQAGEPGNYDKMVEALNNASFKTVLGELDFDESGDVSSREFLVYEWKDGVYDYFQQD